MDKTKEVLSRSKDPKILSTITQPNKNSADSYLEGLSRSAPPIAGMRFESVPLASNADGRFSIPNRAYVSGWNPRLRAHSGRRQDDGPEQRNQR